MARLIPETNEQVDETVNVSLPKVARDGGTSGIAFAIVFHDAMDEIDALLASFDPLVITAIQGDITTLQGDVATLQTDLGTLAGQVGTNTTNIGTNTTNIANNALAITELDNTKEELATLATSSNIVRDVVSGKITEYETALYRFQNPVYVNDKISTYEEIVNGVTTTVTVNRDIEGKILSLSVA